MVVTSVIWIGGSKQSDNFLFWDPSLEWKYYELAGWRVCSECNFHFETHDSSGTGRHLIVISHTQSYDAVHLHDIPWHYIMCAPKEYLSQKASNNLLLCVEVLWLFLVVRIYCAIAIVLSSKTLLKVQTRQKYVCTLHINGYIPKKMNQMFNTNIFIVCFFWMLFWMQNIAALQYAAVKTLFL